VDFALLDDEFTVVVLILTAQVKKYLQ